MNAFDSPSEPEVNLLRLIKKVNKFNLNITRRHHRSIVMRCDTYVDRNGALTVLESLAHEPRKKSSN